VLRARGRKGIESRVAQTFAATTESAPILRIDGHRLQQIVLDFVEKFTLCTNSRHKDDNERAKNRQGQQKGEV